MRETNRRMILTVLGVLLIGAATTMIAPGALGALPGTGVEQQAGLRISHIDCAPEDSGHSGEVEIHFVLKTDDVCPDTVTYKMTYPCSGGSAEQRTATLRTGPAVCSYYDYVCLLYTSPSPRD